MAKYITDMQIRKMSYKQLTSALSEGRITEKRLKSYYTSARRTAQSRQRTTQRVSEEFGGLQKVSLLKLRNITNTQSLLHEIVDVNKYLTSKRSTITGLKQQRSQIIARAEQLGFDIDTDTYADWIKFMNWFKDSEFARAYDSSSEEVAEVFNMAESASPSDWSKAFKEFAGESDKRKQY